MYSPQQGSQIEDHVENLFTEKRYSKHLQCKSDQNDVLSTDLRVYYHRSFRIGCKVKVGSMPWNKTDSKYCRITTRFNDSVEHCTYRFINNHWEPVDNDCNITSKLFNRISSKGIVGRPLNYGIVLYL